VRVEVAQGKEGNHLVNSADSSPKLESSVEMADSPRPEWDQQQQPALQQEQLEPFEHPQVQVQAQKPQPLQPLEPHQQQPFEQLEESAKSDVSSCLRLSPLTISPSNSMINSTLVCKDKKTGNQVSKPLSAAMLRMKLLSTPQNQASPSSTAFSTRTDLSPDSLTDVRVFSSTIKPFFPCESAPQPLQVFQPTTPPTTLAVKKLSSVAVEKGIIIHVDPKGVAERTTEDFGGWSASSSDDSWDGNEPQGFTMKRSIPPPPDLVKATPSIEALAKRVCPPRTKATLRASKHNRQHRHKPNRRNKDTGILGSRKWDGKWDFKRWLPDDTGTEKSTLGTYFILYWDTLLHVSLF
jgi:hypothetical protein